MPNWVTNRLKVKPSIIEKYISKDDNNEEYLDFNKIIPMSDDLKVESGNYGIIGLMILYYLSNNYQEKNKINEAYKSFNPLFKDIKYEELYLNVINTYKTSKNDYKYSIELGKKYLDNYEKYGYTDWYNWSCANWGTKWNAIDFYKLDESLYEFTTAWSSPLPIFKRISEIYPQEIIEVNFADETIGSNCGTIKFQKGDVIEYIDHEGNYEFACDIVGIDYQKFCKEQNGEIDY